MGYKYLMVATFKAVNRNWKESNDEATEEVQRAEEEKEKETDDAFHPQDPIPESESVPQEQEEKKDEQPVSEHTTVLKAIRVKGVKSSSSTGERRVLTERGETKMRTFGIKNNLIQKDPNLYIQIKKTGTKKMKK